MLDIRVRGMTHRDQISVTGTPQHEHDKEIPMVMMAVYYIYTLAFQSITTTNNSMKQILWKKKSNEYNESLKV